MENKQSISETVCPHCHTEAERKISGGFSTDGSFNNLRTLCCNCGKEIKDYWWCETCQDMIVPEHVTLDEHHDTHFGGCGNKVI